MPLVHPDLIGLAKEEYIGMRDPVPGKLRRKYGWGDIAQAVGRSPAGVRVWFGGSPVFDAHHKFYRPEAERVYIQMPRYMSAWMQLIDNGGGSKGAHKYYVLQQRFVTPRPGMRMPGGFPDVSETVSWEKVSEVMADHGLGVLDVENIFWFPQNSYYTVRTLGNDGVSWMLLQLMCDCHPDWRVVAREDIAAINQEVLEEALDYSDLLKELD